MSRTFAHMPDRVVAPELAELNAARYRRDISVTDLQHLTFKQLRQVTKNTSIGDFELVAVVNVSYKDYPASYETGTEDITFDYDGYDDWTGEVLPYKRVILDHSYDYYFDTEENELFEEFIDENFRNVFNHASDYPYSEYPKTGSLIKDFGDGYGMAFVPTNDRSQEKAVHHDRFLVITGPSNSAEPLWKQFFYVRDIIPFEKFRRIKHYPIESFVEPRSTVKSRLHGAVKIINGNGLSEMDDDVLDL